MILVIWFVGLVLYSHWLEKKMRFRAQNSKAREYTTRANRIVRITSDFEMDVKNRLNSVLFQLWGSDCVWATEKERSLITKFPLISGFL